MKFPEDKVRVINMRSMRTGWSKLLNQQEEVLVLTNRGKVVGFYVPYRVVIDNLDRKEKFIFLEFMNAYAKKAFPELPQLLEAEEVETREGEHCLR